VQRLQRGGLVQTDECLECKAVTVTSNTTEHCLPTMAQLSLDRGAGVPGLSVQAALWRLAQPVFAQGDGVRECGHCGLRSTRSTRLLAAPPPLLALHLPRRTENDGHHDAVVFEESLDATCVVDQVCRRTPAMMRGVSLTSSVPWRYAVWTGTDTV
jgi:hypothetical protein